MVRPTNACGDTLPPEAPGPVAATLRSQAPAGAYQGAPNLGQWEGQDVPLVRCSSCFCQRRHLLLLKIPTYPTAIEIITQVYYEE